MERWLLVSRYFPPSPGGTPVLYKNLLKHLDRDRIVVLTAPTGSFVESQASLPPDVYQIASLWPRWLKGRGRLDWANIPGIVAAGTAAVHRHGVTRILATNPDLYFYVAAYLIHRRTGVPLYSYLHDLVLEAQIRLYDKLLARVFQRRILAASRKTFVANEGMAEFYRQRYGMSVVVIPQSMDDEWLQPLADGQKPQQGEELLIAFTGAIYPQNLDALQVAVQVVSRSQDLQLHMASNLREEEARGYGLLGPRVRLAFFPDQRDVLRLQRRASVLYLPLAFHPPYPDETSTVHPQKVLEYLVSGVPILVHAPRHYFLTKSLAAEQCALVVDQPDAEALEAGIRRLLEDQELRRRLVANALRVAQRFRGGPIARRLMEEMFGERAEEFLAKPKQVSP